MRTVLHGRSLPAIASRFTIVGLAATLTYFCAANLLILTTAIPPPLASVAGYGVGMIVSFFGQSRFAFRVEANNRRQFARFLILSAVGITISYVAVAFCGILGARPIFGTIAASILVPLVSFAAMKMWVFAPDDD